MADKSKYNQIFHILAKVPTGRVTTYKALGTAAGGIAPRLVGRVLNANDAPESYPCHRVVRSDGKIASGYAFGGPAAQAEKLADEGVKIEKGVVDLKRYFYPLV